VLGERDHRRRAVIQRAEVLRAFGVEGHLLNGEHDEMGTGVACLVDCTVESPVGRIQTVVAHEDLPLAHRH
jgi:hypothetical protein